MSSIPIPSYEEVERWSHDDVLKWLKMGRISCFVNHFKSQEIDGPALLRMSEGSCMGICMNSTPISMRRNLWDSIRKIQATRKGLSYGKPLPPQKGRPPVMQYPQEPGTPDDTCNDWGDDFDSDDTLDDIIDEPWDCGQKPQQMPPQPGSNANSFNPFPGLNASGKSRSQKPLPPSPVEPMHHGGSRLHGGSPHNAHPSPHNAHPSPHNAHPSPHNAPPSPHGRVFGGTNSGRMPAIPDRQRPLPQTPPDNTRGFGGPPALPGRRDTAPRTPGTIKALPYHKPTPEPESFETYLEPDTNDNVYAEEFDDDLPEPEVFRPQNFVQQPKSQLSQPPAIPPPRHVPGEEIDEDIYVPPEEVDQQPEIPPTPARTMQPPFHARTVPVVGTQPKMTSLPTAYGPPPKATPVPTPQPPIKKAPKPTPLEKPKSDISKNKWYFPKIMRKEAEEKITRLNKNGGFLVRESTKEHPYTLTVLAAGKMKNIQIRKRSNDGKYALGTFKDGEQAFSDVSGLIAYYQKFSLVIAGGGEVTLSDWPKS